MGTVDRCLRRGNVNSFFVLKCKIRSSFATVFIGYVRFLNQSPADTTPIRRIEDRKQNLAQKPSVEHLYLTQYK